ncbi:MAG: hypothetical protein JWO87_1821, partial [Phycisphaerales bacterium]|nr:hypothetical protein [Phycisphaerales bacterium]
QLANAGSLSLVLGGEGEMPCTYPKIELLTGVV